ncbi:MAG TPA: hypothetical protein ENL04_03690, partial [Sulfuricurvum sp.]|nr:hypothetical protein [Sulfuricurvum sp.]
MLNIPEIESVDLRPTPLDTVDLNVSIKNYVLFSEIENETTIILSRKHLSEAFDFLSKIDLDLPIV